MSPSAQAIVSLRNVDKTFESGTVALDGLNLDVREGEFVFFVRRVLDLCELHKRRTVRPAKSRVVLGGNGVIE
jgi:hypothetical protein